MALNTILMERTGRKDEQSIQLLSAEESQSNSPEIQLHRPQTCFNKYWKLLVITPILILLLLLTYWITTRGGQGKPGNTDHDTVPSLGYDPAAQQSPGAATVQNTSSTATAISSPNIDVHKPKIIINAEIEKPNGCLVGLYDLSKQQMRQYQSKTSVPDVRPKDATYTAQLVSKIEEPGKPFTAEILVTEVVEGLTYSTGSSFMAFIGSNHSYGIGLSTDNNNGTYTICCMLPPECSNVTIRLFSFDYSAYRIVGSAGMHAFADTGVRTVYQIRICPGTGSTAMDPGTKPRYCTSLDNNVSMQPGSWIQINQKWFWKSHTAKCLVPDMATNWIPCAERTHDLQFIGDAHVHTYNFYITQFLELYTKKTQYPTSHTFTYAASCKDIMKRLLRIGTESDKLTFVIMHCGIETFYGEGYAAFQSSVTDLFIKAKEARSISPNLRFVFLLSEMRQEVSKSATYSYPDVNMFTSAAINSWIAQHASGFGISVFDDMYPRIIGQAHKINSPMANLLLHKICSIH